MAEQTISITLNGEAKEVAADQTGVQLFAEDKNIIAVRLNGEPRDLYTELHDGDVVEPIALDSEDGLAIMRHSATHVMAQAVQEIRPDAKLGVGPVIKDGFYYDFDVETPFTPDDLKEIEKQHAAHYQVLPVLPPPRGDRRGGSGRRVRSAVQD